MPRAQCLVVRQHKVLMVENHQDGQTWWCLPGGGVEPGETPAEAAMRELAEECMVGGTLIRQTSHVVYSPDDQTYTFLVDIGDQVPALGSDPEFVSSPQVLVGVCWLALDELPERDRAFLWQAGLLGISEYWAEVESWGNAISYPRSVPAGGDGRGSPG